MANPEHTAAYKIFHYYFRCYIAQHQLYSKEYLKNVGVPITGNKTIDSAMANSKTLAQMTIMEMAVHLDNGANLTLEDPRKSVEIYQIIREHLTNWQRQVQTSIVISEAPVEDLRMLDKLASEVYKIAKGYMKNAPIQSGLFGKLRAMEQRRGITKHDSEPVKRTIPEEHKPVTDTIKKESFQRSNNRWR